MKLYKKRIEGGTDLLEVNEDQFRDRDAFEEALDWYLSNGWENG